MSPRCCTSPIERAFISTVRTWSKTASWSYPKSTKLIATDNFIGTIEERTIWRYINVKERVFCGKGVVGYRSCLQKRPVWRLPGNIHALHAGQLGSFPTGQRKVSIGNLGELLSFTVSTTELDGGMFGLNIKQLPVCCLAFNLWWNCYSCDQHYSALLFFNCFTAFLLYRCEFNSCWPLGERKSLRSVSINK